MSRWPDIDQCPQITGNSCITSTLDDSRNSAHRIGHQSTKIQLSWSAAAFEAIYFEPTHTSQSSLKAEVFLWLSRNPGSNARKVVGAFPALSGLQAREIIDSLLAEGLLEFAE